MPCFLANSFTTVDQHTERIEQDSFPDNINPLITHPTHKKSSPHQRGLRPPTFFEQQCNLNDLQSRAGVFSFFHKTRNKFSAGALAKALTEHINKKCYLLGSIDSGRPPGNRQTPDTTEEAMSHRKTAD